MEQIYLSRRNLLTLLSKLDRVKSGDSSLCTIIKSDWIHSVYPQSIKDHIMITAVEDGEYYADREPGRVYPADEPK